MDSDIDYVYDRLAEKVKYQESLDIDHSYKVILCLKKKKIGDYNIME